MAYHFNWSHDEVLRMPHWERHRWCDEISAFNEKHNVEAGAGGHGGREGRGGSADSGGIELVNPEFEG